MFTDRDSLRFRIEHSVGDTAAPKQVLDSGELNFSAVELIYD